MKLQNIGTATIRLTLSATALICASLGSVQAVEDGEKKNQTTRKQNVTSSASISSKVNNGVGVVTYNGEEVWSGEIKNGLRTAARSLVGQDSPEEFLAVAWDGEEVVWENVEGAGGKLKEMSGLGLERGMLEDFRKKIEEMMNRRPFQKGAAKNKSAINGSTTNDKGVVNYKGEEVWTGEVEVGLRVKAEASRDQKKYDGEYAAAWDGEKVVWENVKGAAAELSRQK